MEIDKGGDIDVRDAIAIGHTKHFFVSHVGKNTTQAAAGHGGIASVDKRYAPRFRGFAMKLGPVVAEIESHVGGT